MKQEPFTPGNYFHIFNRGNNKENLFKEAINYGYFINLMKKYLEPIALIYSYCLLPNHFHLLLKIKELDYLPDIYKFGKRKIHQPFSNMFNAYSKAINKKYNRTGSLFQEHLHRIKVDSEEYFKQLILYIHLNPETHGIWEDFSKYSYSSYNAYLNNKIGLLSKEEIINYFDDLDNFKYCHQQKRLKLKVLKEITELDK